MHRYTAELAAEIESRWQDRWEAEATFATPNPAGPLADPEKVAGRPKMFVLDMFPYPSGAGLHVGHPLGYIGTDVYARFKRMTGHNVLHAFGYDAFGLPAEQYAVQTGRHPRATTEANIATMRAQLRRLGLGHDGRRSIATTDVEYYRWTQWIFLQIFNAWYDTAADRARPIDELVAQFESGTRPVPGGRSWTDLDVVERRRVVDGYRLAYQSEEPVNWCPGLGTVLANEEVTADGRSERGNFPVFRRNLKQWMLRITEYADRLLADLDLLQWPEPIKQMQRNWIGRSEGTLKLRDWLFSRQRYWGEPFPIVYDETGLPIGLPAEMLPVELPDLADYRPSSLDPDDAASEPSPPLAAAEDWVTVTLDLGDGPREYRREVNTMPQWAGSCWYELRYLDPTNTQAFVDPEVERYWMGPRPDPECPHHPGGVDLYIGGVEHAVLHLLYARFWHKVLHDLGHLSSREPYFRLYNQGYIQAYAYRDARGMAVPAAEVEEVAGAYSWHGRPVTREYGKMGKSLKNVVTPDEICTAYGADTFRVYEMSTGPLDVSRPWETRAVVGSYRFLQRAWRNLVDEQTGAPTVVDVPATEQTRRILHGAIDGVRRDLEALRFNTAIAKLIELNNHVTSLRGAVPREVAEPLVLMLAPLAPHLAEELWSRLGHPRSLTFEPFPVTDATLLQETSVTCVVQVAGKVQDRLEVPPAISEDDLRKRALACAAVQRALNGREVSRVVVRAPRLVNIVPAASAHS